MKGLLSAAWVPKVTPAGEVPDGNRATRPEIGGGARAWPGHACVWFCCSAVSWVAQLASNALGRGREDGQHCVEAAAWFLLTASSKTCKKRNVLKK